MRALATLTLLLLLPCQEACAGTYEGFAQSEFVEGVTCEVIAEITGAPASRKHICEAYLAKAKAGDAAAMYWVGMWVKGDWPNPRWPSAAVWLERAVDKGDSNAAAALAGMSIRISMVLKHKEMFAEHVPAARELQGLFSPASEVYWVRKAAQLGHPQYMEEMGKRYWNGDGVGASRSAAMEWYSRAAIKLLETNRRDEALRVYDHMKYLDPSSPYVAAVAAALYGPVPAEPRQPMVPEPADNSRT